MLVISTGEGKSRSNNNDYSLSVSHSVMPLVSLCGCRADAVLTVADHAEHLSETRISITLDMQCSFYQGFSTAIAK